MSDAAKEDNGGISVDIPADTVNEKGIVGMGFRGSVKKFWSISMPCGEEYTYMFNGLPEKTVMCRCGDETHYVIKWEENN